MVIHQDDQHNDTSDRCPTVPLLYAKIPEGFSKIAYNLTKLLAIYLKGEGLSTGCDDPVKR